MSFSRRQQGYLVAVLASVSVLVLRLAFRQALAEQALLLPFVLAVMAAAWWGGFGPGLLATALSALSAALFLIPPLLSLRISSFAQGLNAAIFVGVGITISYLCEALHSAHRREAEQQFRVLADSIPQLAWMARPDGYRFWFNRRWYEYTGATPTQMEGSGWQCVYDQGDLPRALESWTASLVSGEPWEETARLHRADGAVRWHLCRAMPVRNTAGRIVCWFGTNTDITDHLEMEQALKEANQRKDEFLATLGHELRNPLAPISNALELWPFVESDRSQMDQLRTMMQRQVRQMTRLIDDLLDVSRISHGKIELHRAPLEISQAISQAIESVRPQLDARGHQLVVTIPTEHVQVQGDLARLTQVFGNLLHNACKFTGQGGTIWISAEAQRQTVRISVRDNGQGIPRPMLSQIFELFRQVEGAIDRAQGGLGIGLTLVKQLVELHGGTVEARSNGPGSGSEFVVTLPRLSLAANASDKVASVESRHTIDLPRHSILVVDDLQESANTLAIMLRSMGQNVQAITDGAAVVEFLLINPTDLVLLDIAMPGMHGYDVARRIRAHRALEEVVLVALTGFGQEADRRQAFEAGFDHHMTKPATAEALRQLLLTLPQHATVK